MEKKKPTGPIIEKPTGAGSGVKAGASSGGNHGTSQGANQGNNLVPASNSVKNQGPVSPSSPLNNQGSVSLQSASPATKVNYQMESAAAAPSMFHLCKMHMNKNVQLTTMDNNTYTGIITHVDDHFVHLATPNWHVQQAPAGLPMGYSEPVPCQPICGCQPSEYSPYMFRDPSYRPPYGYYPYHNYGSPYARPPYYGHGGGYYPGYYPGYNPYGYGYGYGYNPIILPLATLVALSLIP
ncbi:hypothetical protein [Paenibacillus taiwanensis]|uniref:hypothetical protein n=1 Tax=Paenibacillus taiwanensis TaxID=401638 RepID=UPI0004022116|nr:hypothetical protein [Paenibacillus taiwanensis]